MAQPSRLVLTVLLAVATLAGGAARWKASSSRAADPAPDEDARVYLRGALNVARHGVFSFDDPDEDAPRAPGATRAVLFPATLAAPAALADPSAAPAAFFWRAQGVWGFLLAVLAALLAVMAAGPLAGLAAGALLAFDPLALQHAGTLNIQLFFGALVVLVGLALLRWGRAPTPANAALAGIAVGASLLARSTLAPFLLFLPLWAAASRRRLERPWLALALFWGAALLAALPWPARNRLLLGRWQPFEAGVVEYGVVAGASGRVSDDFPSGSPDTVSLTDMGRERRGPAAALGEAAGLAARAPASWLAAVTARAGFWGWGLLAWLPAALALRRARREDLGLWLVGGLAAYWNVHLLMLSSARHFIPAFAPLAAVAAAAFAPRPPSVPPWTRRLAAAALAVPLLLVLLAWTVIGRELSRTPRAGAAERRLDAAAAAFAEGRAGDARARLAAAGTLAPWQTVRAARLHQALGEPAACEALFMSALKEHPRGAGLATDAAVCAALAGDASRAEGLTRFALRVRPGHLPAALTLGAVLEGSGRRADAVRVYDAALAQNAAPAEDPLRRSVATARLAALGRPRERR